MSDVKCPYCGHEQEINHDDGYGYEDGESYEQDCVSCEREFKFTTTITFSYSVFCKEGDHELEPLGDKWPGMYECSKCDYFCKRPTTGGDKDE